MDTFLTEWLPVASLVAIAFGLAIKDAKQAHSIRLLERENEELRMKQVELNQRNIEQQSQILQMQSQIKEKPDCGVC